MGRAGGRRRLGAAQRAAAAALSLAALACGAPEHPATAAAGGPAAGWPSYGGDVGGRRYSPLSDITRDNVADLAPAWVYHTGDLPDSRGEQRSSLAAEVTPILVDETLYLCTPYNRVIALDPETGRERWSYDPHIDLSGEYANQLVCRGVAAWLDPERPAGAACRRRIFSATNDARLLALDGASGEPCRDFGAQGSVDLNPSAGPQLWRGEYQVTSPPAVAGDLVIVGSAVCDNHRTDAPSGVVRAFDARTGALRWAWDLAPPGFVHTRENSSEAGYALSTPNVWAPMSVDAERDLLFVPTGNPSPDYFRGDQPPLDAYGSSLVALRASTGAVVWHFQTVHHDLWDFDVPSQPTLFTLRRGGREIPAVAQATKMGLVFVLDRESGKPLFPVEERPVPQAHAPGEHVAPTQPFPVRPPGLSRQTLSPDEVWGLTPWDRGACRRQLEALRFDGMYTAPTLEGTLMLPGNAGGTNWGGVALDEARQRLVVNTQDLAWVVRLYPRDQTPKKRAGHELAPMRGTPYVMTRDLLLSPLGVPCSPPPWGQLAAVDLASGEISWQVPLGSLRDVAPLPLPLTLGVPNLGGPLLTASGLVFIGAAFDYYFRAFDADTGAELWRTRLLTGAQATPMTYRVREGGPQYVVIAAMGYGRAGMKPGDTLVAFTLGGRRGGP